MMGGSRKAVMAWHEAYYSTLRRYLYCTYKSLYIFLSCSNLCSNVKQTKIKGIHTTAGVYYRGTAHREG
jgi:hypothetical protein